MGCRCTCGRAGPTARCPMARPARCPNEATSGSGLFLLLEFPLVEGELLALEDVAVNPPALPRPRGDARQQAAALELLLHRGVELLLRLARLQLEDHVAALFLLLRILLLAVLAGLLLADLALPAEVHAVLFQVPLLVGLRVDLDDRVLRQRLRAHQLVARRVVHDVQDPDLLRAIFRAPGDPHGCRWERNATSRSSGSRGCVGNAGETAK